MDLSGWHLELEGMRKLQGREMVPQRFVITPDVLALGRVDGDSANPDPSPGEEWDDVIPLHEIQKTQDLEKVHDGDDDDSGLFEHLNLGLVAIFCEDGGYNTGRKYCVQLCQQLFLRSKLQMVQEKAAPFKIAPKLPGSDCPDIPASVTDFCALLDHLSARADARKRPKSLFIQSRLAARWLFTHFRFQVCWLFVARVAACTRLCRTRVRARAHTHTQTHTRTHMHVHSALWRLTGVFFPLADFCRRAARRQLCRQRL